MNWREIFEKNLGALAIVLTIVGAVWHNPTPEKLDTLIVGQKEIKEVLVDIKASNDEQCKTLDRIESDLGHQASTLQRISLTLGNLATKFETWMKIKGG